MNGKSGFASDFLNLSRRDAIRLIAATPASGAVFAAPLPALASARPTISDAVGQFPHGPATRPRDLAKLAAEHFEPLIGQEFLIAGKTATLVGVHRGAASEEAFRRQFAVTFDAPQLSKCADVVPVSHPAIGCHELHVTQVGCAEIEICFS